MTRAQCIVAGCAREVVDPIEFPEYPDNRCRYHAEEQLKKEAERADAPRPRHFCQLGIELIYAHGLDDQCFRILALLDRLQFRQGRDKSKPVRGGVTRLASLLGKDHSTVSRHLKHLEAAGWVHVESVNRSNKLIWLSQNSARHKWSPTWLAAHPDYNDPSFNPETTRSIEPKRNTNSASDGGEASHEPIEAAVDSDHEVGAPGNQFVTDWHAEEDALLPQSADPVSASDHEPPIGASLSSYVSGTSSATLSDEESHWGAILGDWVSAESDEEPQQDDVWPPDHLTPTSTGGPRRKARLGELASTRRRPDPTAVDHLRKAFGPGTRLIDPGEAARIYRHRDVPLVPDGWHSNG